MAKVYNVEVLKVERFSVELCRQNPKILYIFGDNLAKIGKGGQAIIRDEPNAFGVPTKRLPSMSNDAFFRDRIDEIEAVENALYELSLERHSRTINAIAFPEDGLGTGLARMKTMSPKLFRKMNDLIRLYFFPDGGWDF